MSTPKVSLSKPPLRKTAGAVLFADGRVLLCKVANGFNGYAWTLPKGKIEPGESVETAAKREVLEETGYTSRLLHQLPGAYNTLESTCIYYLGTPIERKQPFDPRETEAIAWVTPQKAEHLLSQTRNIYGRARDLRALGAARRALGV